MRYFLATLAGSLVGAAVIVAVAVAVPQTTPQTPPVSGMPMSGAMGGAMMNVATAPVRKLMIVHVQRGCHVWSNGKTTMRIHLRPGQRLSIMNMDVDAHQLLRFYGTMDMAKHMGRPMSMNHGMTVSFAKKGVYRLGTTTVEMPGRMEVETIGPDNSLRLVVTVA